MKQYIVAFFLLLLLPMQSHAKLSYAKIDLLWEADYHRKEAISQLTDAQKMCVYIPDLGSRDHMKALLGSIISTAAVKDPREKVLLVGLGLITSMVHNVYDKYCDMRTSLYTAAYHLDMANFYNQLSLHASGNKSEINSGTKEFFAAIDNLTICVMICECIKDPWVKKVVGGYLVDERSELIQQFKLKNGNLSRGLYDEALTFCENVYEVSGEIEEEGIRDDICMYVYSAVECLAAALRNLEGYDCWPDLDSWRVSQMRLMLVNNGRLGLLHDSIAY